MQPGDTKKAAPALTASRAGAGRTMVPAPMAMSDTCTATDRTVECLAGTQRYLHGVELRKCCWLNEPYRPHALRR